MRVAGSICIKEFYLHIFLPKHQRTQNGHVLEAQASSGDGFYFLTTLVVIKKQQNICSYSAWKKNSHCHEERAIKIRASKQKREKANIWIPVIVRASEESEQGRFVMTSHRQLLWSRGKHLPDCISLELLIPRSITIWVLLQDSFYSITF